MCAGTWSSYIDTTPLGIYSSLACSHSLCISLTFPVTPVITEISSAQGNKNSASSKQDWSHSWHKINSTALQKGQKLYKMTKNLKGALQNPGAHAYAHNSNRTMRASAHDARLLGEKPARLLNGAFIKLVGLPTTNGSAPKSI
jgi:hypothetical protein